MAVEGKAFAISFVFNFCIGLVCLLSFNILRVNKFSRKYYAPKRILKIPDRAKPKRLPNGFITWMRPLFNYKESELIETAGMDAVINFRLIQFGVWLFLILTILCNVTILPTNLSGNFIDRIQSGEVQGASFTTGESAPSDVTEGQASNFTGCDVEGEISGSYSDMDRTSLTNVEQGNNKMWVHLIMVYVVSIIVFRMLAQYHEHAVQLRLEYLASQKRGAESHTVFVTDIPGIQSGTQLDRAYQLINSTAGRFVPQKIKKKIEEAVFATADSTIGTVARALQKSNSGIIDNEKNGESEAQEESVYQSSHEIQTVSTSQIKLRVGKVSTPRFEPNTKSPNSSGSVKEFTDMHPWQKVEAKLHGGMGIRDVVFYEFDEVFPGQVENAFPVYNQQRLWGLYLTYEKTKQNIEDIVDHITSKIRRKKKIKRPEIQIIPSVYGAWCVQKYKHKKDPTGIKPVKVDKLNFWLDYLPELKKQIDEQKEVALQNYTSSAFVTFKSRTNQVVSATSLHHHDELCWRTQTAPAPSDIVWENLKFRQWEVSYRTILSWTLFVLLMMFFAIPVGAIQTFINRLLNPDEIGNEFLRSVLAGILPGLALKVFLILVPIILSFLNYKEGLIAHSFVDFEVVRKYYLFQTLVVYLYTIGFSSLSKEFECIRDDPSSIIDKLARGVPQNATYFMTYIILLGFSAKPIQFLRLPGLVIYWIMSKLAATERAKNRLWQEQYMLYGPEIPEHTITILIGLCFCCVQPLITPICLLYFVAATVISRYQLLYVYREKFQSGGRMWPICFQQILVSLFFFQLTMLGLLGIKKFAYAPLIIPVIIYGIIFWINMDRLYKRPLTVMSLRAAADIDANEIEINGPLDEKYDQQVMQLYLSPCFKIKDDDYNALIEEITQCEQKLSNVGQKSLETELVGCGQTGDLNKEDQNEDQDDDDVDSNGKQGQDVQNDVEKGNYHNSSEIKSE